mmetsp:Transcript_13454/g.42496  ORF Transcript_13454/g.42496 Transcript_13454/m.42496 type:complete len:343 (-) Transcript_13454:44-1072(-)
MQSPGDGVRGVRSELGAVEDDDEVEPGDDVAKREEVEFADIVDDGDRNGARSHGVDPPVCAERVASEAQREDSVLANCLRLLPGDVRGQHAPVDVVARDTRTNPEVVLFRGGDDKTRGNLHVCLNREESASIGVGAPVVDLSRELDDVCAFLEGPRGIRLLAAAEPRDVLGIRHVAHRKLAIRPKVVLPNRIVLHHREDQLRETRPQDVVRPDLPGVPVDHEGEVPDARIPAAGLDHARHLLDLIARTRTLGQSIQAHRHEKHPRSGRVLHSPRMRRKRVDRRCDVVDLVRERLRHVRTSRRAEARWLIHVERDGSTSPTSLAQGAAGRQHDRRDSHQLTVG